MSGTRNAVRTRKNKERSKNFTELEKRTVLELINQHREVLRQGRSNNATNKSKQMVWSQICIEVNKRCRAECPRTPAQVKMWYENFKKKCKMRYQEPGSEEGGVNLLDGMLWTINPLAEALTVKDERRDVPSTVLANPDDHLPVNMSSERLDGSGSICDSKDGIHHGHLDLLEPQMSLSHSPGPASPSPSPMMAARAHNLIPVITSNSSNPDSNGPLNLSHLEPRVCIDTPSPQDESSPNFPQYPNRCGNTQLNKKCPRGFFARNSNNAQDGCCNSDAILPHNNNNLGNYFCANSAPTEEEKLYYMAKRQHAIWEHEAKMKILNMELRQKEEIFSLQKQLFLIELKLKMDFLEKNSNK